MVVVVGAGAPEEECNEKTEEHARSTDHGTITCTNDEEVGWKGSRDFQHSSEVSSGA